MGIISNGNTVIDNGAIDANEVDTTQLATDAVETAKIADGAVTGVKLSGLTNFKNIIINGDMSLDQRNSGSSVTMNTTSNTYTLDRWVSSGQVSDGVFTVEQDTDAPTGFTNCSKITVTTADASIGSTQSYLFSQFIEGNNISYLDFGTSNAKTITLSFWVKSSLTGTFGGVINNSDNTKAYPFTYSISSANTWEKKSVTITGDTSGTYPTDNNRGMALRFQIGVGSSQVDTPGVWTGASPIYGATGATNIISTLNATWQITGVQLEAGTTASDFEFLPHDVNLLRCQRYFGKSYNQGTNPGTNTWTGTMIARNYDSSTRGENPFLGSFKVNMRTVPTVTIYSKAGNTGKIVSGSTSINTGGTEYNVTAIFVTETQITGITATITGTHFGQAHYTADAEL